MVCRLIEGWESSTATADYAGKWTSITGSGSSITASGRFGNAWRSGTTGTNSITRLFDSQATWVLGFALRVSGAPGASRDLCAFLDGATAHCGLAMDAGGVLFAWRGTNATSIGSTGTGPSLNLWHYVEVKATIADSPSGVFVVKLNGTTVLNLTTADTRNSATATANTVRLGNSTGTVGALWDFDDIYVFDATGTTNTDFAGDCKVEQVLPTGAGATTAWTPSAGSNWQCVDEAPPTGDTDYVSSSTAAQTDTYACGDLSVATSGTVKAVQASVLARKDDAGSRSLALVARPGSTDRVGATQAVSDSYARYAQVWDTNPDTAAAWTVGEVNSSQFGQRLIS